MKNALHSLFNINEYLYLILASLAVLAGLFLFRNKRFEGIFIFNRVSAYIEDLSRIY